MKMLAQTTGIPVVAGPSESTAIGNIIVQIEGTRPGITETELRSIALKSSETITYK